MRFLTISVHCLALGVVVANQLEATSVLQRGVTNVVDDGSPPACTTSLVSPKPPGAYCGATGAVNVNKQINSLTTPDATECRLACLSSLRCLSMSFNSATSNCTLYPSSLGSLGFQTSGSSTNTFWDRNCYAIACNCAGTETLCNFECVNLQNSRADCGTCGNVCPSGAKCNAGQCNCPKSASSTCGSSCVNLQSDGKNCGTCGTTCPGASSCSNGQCRCNNPAYSICGSTCVRLSNDTSNCGTCGNTCSSDQTCTGGQCTCTDTKESVCGTTCKNLMTDNNNCGSCGNQCPSGQYCNKGQCSCSAKNLSACGSDCVNLKTDENNCGVCNNQCPAGQNCSQGGCVCANSGAACPSGQECNNSGVCVCSSNNESVCGTSCFDLNSDNNNCGSCGNTCPGAQSCTGGQCSCPNSDQTLCNGACINLQTDANNCGTCGNTCGQNESCVNGACACASPKLVCNNACIDPSSDPNNCGSCGNTCDAAFSTGSCTNSQCVVSPPSGCMNAEFCDQYGNRWIYSNYYYGSGFEENTNNPGNYGFAPETFTLDSSYGRDDVCGAANECSQLTFLDYAESYSFDLHFLISQNAWVCIAYNGQNSNASYFNVPNSDVLEGYGYVYANMQFCT